MYWSEWFNDPPACCDPCNQCGYYADSGGGCLRSYVRQRRQSFFHSLFGPSDCNFGHYALDGQNCPGGIDRSGYDGVDDQDGYVIDGGCGCAGGCNPGGFALGFHRFCNSVLNFGTGRGCGGCDCVGDGPASGCGNSPIMPDAPPGPAVQPRPARQEPTPAEELPPPPPAKMQQSKRSRVLVPAVYNDAFKDVFDDDALPTTAGSSNRILR
jgi:hypothetical protein